MVTDHLLAAILVGGQSRRMGRNKALLPVPPHERTIVETVVEKIGTIASEIVLLGSELSAYAFLDLPAVTDDPAGIGPLGGIRAALNHSGERHVLVVACDMPLLNPGLLAYMASCPHDYDVLLPDVDLPQPMHAIYSPTSLPAIEQCIDEQRYRVTGLLEHVHVRALGRDEIRRYDPECRSWFNANTPEEYKRARHVLAGSEQASHSRKPDSVT